MINKKTLFLTLAIIVVIIVAVIILIMITWNENQKMLPNKISQQELIQETQTGAKKQELNNTPTKNKIEEILNKWNLSFQLPSENWEFDEMDESEDNVVYFFTNKNGYKNSDGEIIYPSIGFMFEELEEEVDAIYYSMKFEKYNKNTKSYFTNEDGLIRLKNAFGIVAVQSEYNGGKEHTMKIVYAVNKKNGIFIVMDSTTDVFEKVETDFDFVLKSLKFNDQE
ncbi:MAG: hypothetical protein V3574_03125 [Candidatus Moraniibacteriota bacterium]